MNAACSPALSRHRLVGWTMACLLALSGMAAPLRALDCYLKLEGIPGEITTGPMTGWSLLSGMSAGVSVPPTEAPDLPAKPVLTLDVSKPVGAISPEMMVRCATGQIIPRLSLLCRNGTEPLLRITLQEVQVVTCETRSGSEAPTEQISFNFAKIEWSYFRQEGANGGTTATFSSEDGKGTTKIRQPFRASLENRPGVPGLVLTCPVEAGHRYRVASSPSPGGPWKYEPEFTAAEDGTLQQTLSLSDFRLFLRLEEVD